MVNGENSIRISVIMVTYGHEKYIQKAIEGVLMQYCNFNIELIVANDNSPDNTDEVIKKYLSENNISRNITIKYTKHDFNKGMQPNYIWSVKQAVGKYIAVCEGDDYWTDPLKLQKQVDFLEANEDYVLTFHPVHILKPDGSLLPDYLTTVPINYETQETLARLGNYIHTPSVVFRNIIKSFPLEFELSPIGDYFLYMLLTNHGKIKMLDDTMAVYRYGVGIISKMNGMRIANSNVRMYSCMLSALDDFKIKKIIFDRQLEVVNIHYQQIEDQYKHIVFLPKWYVFLSTRLNLFVKDPKDTFVRLKNKIKRFLG